MTNQDFNVTSASVTKTESRWPLIKTHGLRIYRQTGSLGRLIKFWARACFDNQRALDWYRFIDTHPTLCTVPAIVKAVLADKIHRPFARCNISVDQRIDLLERHYELMASILPPQFVAKLVAGERFPIAHLVGKKDGENFTLTLSREMLSQHQGELTFLMIDDQTQVLLARLVANVANNDQGKPTFTISGMQGPGPIYKKDIVQVTRHLDGLRPKRAVLDAACAMAHWMGIDQVVATAKHNHVSQTKKKWQKRVMADYDSFWLEFEPTTTESGDFYLPSILPRRNADDVLPKKRREWERRCERQDGITAEATASLQAFTKFEG